MAKLYEPVPASYAAELEFDLGSDRFEVPLGEEPFYPTVFSAGGGTIGEEGGGVDFFNHRTFVWKISDGRIRGRSWRYATSVRLTDGGQVDRIRYVRL